MALRKNRAGKGSATKKAAGPSKPRRKRPAGKGHNKPPADSPPISSWHTDDQSGALIARQTARQRQQHLAAIGSGPIGSPFPPTHDPSVLHAAMLKRVAALEEATAGLFTSAEGQIKPRPLDDSDLDEIRRTIGTLKTLPPVPAKPPTEAVGAQSKLAQFGEKILVSLATMAITEASKEFWARYGDQLKALAHAIGEWIANLPRDLAS
jgi:hypothetical protein